MKIILLMAMTADGLVARHSMQFVDWTGKEDKQYFVRITREAGAMIMGSKTFDTIGRPLPGRKNIVMTRDKTRQSHDPALIFTDAPPSRIIQDLAAQGHRSAALVGGPMINTLFIQERLVDEIHVTLVPRLFGQGMTMFSQPLDVQLEVMGIQTITPAHVLIQYKVNYHAES